MWTFAISIARGKVYSTRTIRISATSSWRSSSVQSFISWETMSRYAPSTARFRSSTLTGNASPTTRSTGPVPTSLACSSRTLIRTVCATFRSVLNSFAAGRASSGPSPWLSYFSRWVSWATWSTFGIRLDLSGSFSRYCAWKLSCLPGLRTYCEKVTIFTSTTIYSRCFAFRSWECKRHFWHFYADFQMARWSRAAHAGAMIQSGSRRKEESD